MSTPTSAEAWQVVRRGAMPGNLELRTVQLPKLKPSQVLVKVTHAALNPVDYKLAALMPSFIQTLPRTAASDFSGVVVELGSEDLSQQRPWLKTGVPVYGIIANVPPFIAQGALQTYSIAEVTHIAPLPTTEAAREAGVTQESAAGLALSQSTYVKQGDRVFINGGTTAVGLLAADLTLKKGASLVVATASGSKADVIKERGVHETIDHRAVDAKDELIRRYKDSPFDVVLDCVGGKALHEASAAYLKPGGKWVNVGASALSPDSSVFSSEALGLALWNIRARLPAALGGHARPLVAAGAAREKIANVNEYLAEGALHPLVDQVFSWEQVPDAYRYLIQGRALGKIVVTVSP
ncbi:hypothetical protein V8E36_003859 [Tilletia maclaganii]